MTRSEEHNEVRRMGGGGRVVGKHSQFVYLPNSVELMFGGGEHDSHANCIPTKNLYIILHNRTQFKTKKTYTRYLVKHMCSFVKLHNKVYSPVTC